MQNLNLLPESSDQSNVILVQLMKAKSEMGSTVKKDSANPFHKSKYASLGAHLELSEEILAKHGLLMLHTPTIINNQHVLTTTLHHPESSQWIKSYLPLLNPKEDSQGVGASLTYMRRYSINSMLGLTTEDDDGETAAGRGKYAKQSENEDKKNTQAPPDQKDISLGKLSKQAVSTLMNLLHQLDEETRGSFREWIKKDFKALSIHDIPTSGFDRCVSLLTNKIKYFNDKLKQEQEAVI